MKYIVAFLLLASPVYAQEKITDPDYLAKLVNILQAQRNQAMDSLTISEAKAAKLTEDLAAAKKRIEELEKKGQK
jgi:hypothetical protein